MSRADRSSVPIPVWARLADVVTIVFLVLGALVLAFGGFRLRFDTVRLSLMSPLRLLLVAVMVGAVRHALVRREPLYERAVRGLVAAWRSEDLRVVWPLWLWSRLGVLAVGFMAVATIGYSTGAEPPFRVYPNELLNLPARYDTGWYLGIATDGYQWSPGQTGPINIAFMPALPMLMRVGGRLIGNHPLLAGQIIVLVACLWGFVYVYRLARDLTGDAERAAVAVALLTAYPFAMFLGAVYTESLFLLAAAGGFYHAIRRQPLQTAAFALLAGFARPNGFLLSVPLGVVILAPVLLPTWSAWRTWTTTNVVSAIREAWPTLLAAAAAVAGVVVYSAYIYSLTGRPLTWLEAHAAWGRTFSGAADFVIGPYYEMARLGLYEFVRSNPVNAMNGVAAALALVAVIPVTARYGLAYGVFILINVIPPLMVGGWLSIGRVTVGMFPIFVWLADVMPARQRAAWLIAFATTQGFAAALFYTWRTFI
jgi:hypothetical protein